MPKRPDQHNLDQNEAGATDYKFRRQTQERNRRYLDNAEQDRANRATSQTPGEAMEARRQQSERDREDELERAAGVRERGEGRHEERGESGHEERGESGREDRGELNVSSGRARAERREREARDREEIGRESLETRGRSMADAVNRRAEREAEENETR